MRSPNPRNRLRLQKLFLWLATGGALLAFIAFIIFAKIINIQIVIEEDKYSLVAEEKALECLQSLKNKRLVQIREKNVKELLDNCNLLYSSVSLDKKFPHTLIVKFKGFEPIAKIIEQNNKTKTCWLIDSNYMLKEVEDCTIAFDMSIIAKVPVKKNLNLIILSIDFNQLLQKYLSKVNASYLLENYKDVPVVKVRFDKKLIILNPNATGEENFYRFYQAYKGLEKLHETYRTMNLLFDRVVIK